MSTATRAATESASDLAILGGTPIRQAESRQYPVWSDAAKEHVARLLNDGVALGLSRDQPEIGAVEEALAEFHGVSWALGTSTGNGALHAALIGLELTDGDEVLTSPYSYGVSVSCILQNNCIPTFADVLEGTGLLDPVSVEERLTERTRAILVPHIFGNPADMTALCDIAQRRGVKVIEDGSQAHGALHRGVRVGGIGDVGGFSSNGFKPLPATEAGYMVTRDEDTYWRAVVSTQHGGAGAVRGRASDPGFPEELREAVDGLVYTYRLTPLDAALLLDGLTLVDAQNEVRRRHLEVLRKGIEGLSCVSLPSLLHEGDESAVHQVVMTFHRDLAGISKETFLKAVNAEGFFCYEYAKRPLHLAPRLSPNWDGPRVMWTGNLRRAGYDATKLELPRAENQVRDHFNFGWNYVTYDPDFIGRIVDVFVKVEDNLDALRSFERAEQSV